MSKKTAVIIFKSFILSRFEYGGIFCIGSNAGMIDRLQKLVNRCLRFCIKLPFDYNVAEIHIIAKLLPLKIRRNISLLKIMFEESQDCSRIV